MKDFYFNINDIDMMYIKECTVEGHWEKIPQKYYLWGLAKLKNKQTHTKIPNMLTKTPK